MKKIVLAVLLLVSVGLFAQKRTVNVGDFTTLKTFNGLQVILYQSDKQYVEVFGDDTDEIIIKNVNGVLKVSAKLGKKIWGEDLYVKVYFKNLDIIDVNEGSFVKSKETFKQNTITVKAQEGAIAHLHIDVKSLDAKTISGGEIRLDGSATIQHVIANTGGMYEAFEVESETVTVKASSGGDIEVIATKSLKANANTGGMIAVKGNPTQVNKKTSLGGSITMK